MTVAHVHAEIAPPPIQEDDTHLTAVGRFPTASRSIPEEPCGRDEEGEILRATLNPCRSQLPRSAQAEHLREPATALHRECTRPR